MRPKWIETTELAAARVLFGLPPSVQVLLSGRPSVVIEGERLHPNMQLLLSLERQVGLKRSLSHELVDVARRRMFRNTTRFARTIPEVSAVRELTIPGPAGPMRAWHYAPESSRPEPLLVFLHGGGFALGGLETHDYPCRVLCKTARLHVLSVDYRLAPENPYPAAVDDAVAALRFAQNEAPALGADPNVIAMGGDSAGGQLSAVVAQRTRGDRPPALQLLLYPTVDIGGSEWASRQLFGRGFLLTTEDIAWFDQAYTLGKDGQADPGLAPLQAADFSGLCPAIVVTCGFDPLRDEGEAYAKALEKAGNRVVAWREPGLLHGFAHMGPISRVCRQAMERTAVAVGTALRS
ncbi:MAG TPA: alpha/beta hydrolase [Polyangiales bacterium]|nr:alpha/beta hydrolase [Polyangiales bacterium]